MSDEKIPKRNYSQLQKRHLTQINTDHGCKHENIAFCHTESTNQFKALIEETSALIFVIQSGKIRYANLAAMLITNYSQSQLLSNGDFYRQLNPQGYSPENFIKDYHSELKIRLNSGKERWLNCHWAKIEWNSELGIAITAFDITKYKHEQLKAHQALVAKQKLCQNKTKFVSMVSHEFRTPLNIISFSTSLLKRHLYKWTEAKQLEYLNRLQIAVEHLSHLIDEVLIIGKVEAGKLKFSPQPFNLVEFCQQLVAEIHLSQAYSSRINFNNQLEHQTVLADENLLKPVLVNILTNAAKYSPINTKIEFTIFCHEKQVIFQIVDRGIGIPVEEQVKIFEPFQRSNNVGNISGNGLGLAIAKRVIEVHGGQICLESRVDQGSKFIVKIPNISS